jgi:hypothetical protein
MASIGDGTTVTAREDGDDWQLTADGDVVGRIRGSEVEVGDLTATVLLPGERSTRVLQVGGRRPVLRLDAAGRKATWMTLSRSRCRLARQRYRPLQRRWVLTRDVEGPAVLRVSQTGPGGTRLSVLDTDGFSEEELAALVAGTLVVALDVPARERAGV